MGIGDFLKKKFTSKFTDGGDSVDPVDLTLKRMKTGYYVDYDMKTWQIVSTNRYDWGDEDITHEWQLESFDETLYLELEPDDEDYWNLSRKRPFRDLDQGVRDTITQSDEPPDEILFEGKKFFLDETGGALFYKENDSSREVFKWDYTDDSGKYSLTIEQWGETDYELSVGREVEEYQFSNILPSA